ncbi:polyribonucleotide nucleotidyltransferase [Coprothermobacteraceae bacterium]|nr:polyribonucleotide nucleotidyltransferase [Coprothermobacteraceae bacterium]
MLERRKIEVVGTVAGKSVTFNTGFVALQANGAVLARFGDTVVLSAVLMSDEPKLDVDFFPLTVDYEEKSYAVGKIPGGFIKKEGRPSDSEILKARLIDRSIRPMFPDGMRNEVQVQNMVLAADLENPPDIVALNATAAALAVSDVPIPELIAGVRVGFVDGHFVLNPTFEEMSRSSLDLVVAGTREAIVMIEAGAAEVPKTMLLEGLAFAQDGIRQIIDLIAELQAKVGREKAKVTVVSFPEQQYARLCEFKEDVLRAIISPIKQEREDRLKELKKAIAESMKAEFADFDPLLFGLMFHELEKDVVRDYMRTSRKRVDGRAFDEIRPLYAEAGVLPRVHGSGLFIRGQTQVLSTVTLGSFSDVQFIDAIGLEEFKRFMHHYDFPPFSTGEVKPRRGPSRREIGHGALVERALSYVIPPEEEFPYTIRVVSEVLESNGSTSMASTCASSIALMNAGVPIPKHVGGIAMGLVEYEDEKIVLTDIQGIEDHLGDMDFKVAGTRDGITALQLDVKVKGISIDTLDRALDHAEAARAKILDVMYAAIEKPYKLSESAPRIVIIEIPVEKIGEVIGPGGRNVKRITQETGATVDIREDGTVFLRGNSDESVHLARQQVEMIVKDPEVGDQLLGRVVKVTPSYAIVEVAPGKSGLLHVSEFSKTRVRSLEEVLHVGDPINVWVKEKDGEGRLRFTAKGRDKESEDRKD